LALEVVGRGEVVRMWVGVEDPLELKALVGDEGQQFIGADRTRRPRLFVVIEHRVDDRAALGARVGDHVLDREGARIVEAGNFGLGGHGLTSRLPNSWMRLSPAGPVVASVFCPERNYLSGVSEGPCGR